MVGLEVCEVLNANHHHYRLDPRFALDVMTASREAALTEALRTLQRTSLE